jgi:Icc-related predicted phosphoesterase
VKILAVSDVVQDNLYSLSVRENFSDVRLLLGCGDLPYEYLEFLVTALNIPLLYIPGNHDPAFDENRPEAEACGCEFLDRRVTRVNGLNIAGIGGSIRYHPHKSNQYSQSQMYARVLSFYPALYWHRIRYGGGLDILIAHSPPRGIHDDSDPAHVGFSAFIDLIRIFKPRYFLHGHTMVYKSNLIPPITRVGATTVINVYPYRQIEIEPRRR